MPQSFSPSSPQSNSHPGDTIWDTLLNLPRCSVMSIEWDYNYYQPWSDNEWLVDEMLAMLDKNVTMQ